MINKTFGWLSALNLLLLPSSLIALLAVISRQGVHKLLSSTFFMLLVMSIMGVFLFKIIRINNQTITVISIFNPFRKKIKIPLNEIENIVIRNNSFGGTTSIIINEKDDKILITTSFARFERNRLKIALLNEGLKVDEVQV